jgi:hypothetical protein
VIVLLKPGSDLEPGAEPPFLENKLEMWK